MGGAFFLGIWSYIKAIYHGSRRKTIANPDHGKLAKELNMMDVILLSIGNSIGMGSYILIGKHTVELGPGLIVTYVLNSGLIIMSALCYADFIRRENSSGGAYTCTYLKLGELHAFCVGSALIIQHMVATALSARGFSIAIDEMCGKVISHQLRSHVTFHSPFLTEYPDVIGFLIPIVSIAIVSFDMKTVININNFCCLSNLALFILIIAVFGSNLDFSLWSLPPSPECGKGGFFPYGIKTVFDGMATVYITFIGFDGAGNAGAEVKDPERIIPLSLTVAAIMISILCVFNALTYTLVWSYCDQQIEDPIPDIMTNLGLDIMKWITKFGLPLGMLGNYICNTFPTSRIFYSMAEDGLLYSFLAKVNEKTKTPIYALYTTGIMAGLLTLFIGTEELVQLASLSALVAYSLLSYFLLIVNYSDEEMERGNTSRRLYKIIFNLESPAHEPTTVTSTIVRVCCWLIFFTSFPAFQLLKMRYNNVIEGSLLEISLLIICLLFYLFITTVIYCQPISRHRLSKMKVVPVLPMIVILTNTYLSLEYSFYSWLHGFICFLIGFLIYVTYGVWNSKAIKQNTVSLHTTNVENFSDLHITSTHQINI